MSDHVDFTLLPPLDIAGAAFNGLTDEVRRHIAGGSDVNDESSVWTPGYGWTPLMAAASKGHCGIVR